MKFAALILIASLLIEIFALNLSFAAGRPPIERIDRLQLAETNGGTGQEQEPVGDSDADITEGSPIRFDKTDIVVRLSGELNLSELEKGMFTYLVYRFEKKEKAEIAEVIDIDVSGIVIHSRKLGWHEASFRRHVALDNISMIAIGQTREDIQNWLHQKRPKIRIAISSDRRIIGRTIRVNRDTLTMRTERGSVQRIPLHSIGKLEIKTGRSRNTFKGAAIGAVLGGLVAATRMLYWRRLSIGCFLVPTLIGSVVKSDTWAETSPHRLNLSIAPTQNRRLTAALLYKF